MVPRTGRQRTLEQFRIDLNISGGKSEYGAVSPIALHFTGSDNNSAILLLSNDSVLLYEKRRCVFGGLGGPRLQIPQRRPRGLAAGIAANHAAALLPAALAFDLVGGRAVLSYAVDSGRRKPASESAVSRATLIVSPIAFISASDT